MKLPNHYGTITKLSGNRRRPFIIREGNSGHQKAIGYAITREEALILLAKYNKNPWDIEADKITLQELYELWVEKRAIKLGIKNFQVLKSAYNHCKMYANCRYNQIKSFQMQEAIDNCGLGYSTQAQIKNLWGHLDRFASELDVISKMCSTLLTSDPIPETTKTIFTDEEVSKIWGVYNEGNTPFIDSVIFFLYTGFRISEFLKLRIQSVNVEERTIIGGTKTAAGKNRIVPIHSKIWGIVKRRMDESRSGFLFENSLGKHLTPSAYYDIWENLMKALEMNHTPHECRHTFRSRLDSAGANKVCIDRMMGHKSKGTGERVYTHKTIEELRKNIELITN